MNIGTPGSGKSEDNPVSTQPPLRLMVRSLVFQASSGGFESPRGEGACSSTGRASALQAGRCRFNPDRVQGLWRLSSKG